MSDLETEHLKFRGAKRRKKKRMKKNEEKPVELIGHNQTIGTI